MFCFLKEVTEQEPSAVPEDLGVSCVRSAGSVA